MPPELIQLVDKLFSLDALKLALLGILVLAAAPTIIAYVKSKRERRNVQRAHAVNEGREMISFFEETEAPFPRHWSTYVDSRIDHKLRNMLEVPMTKLRDVEGQVREVKKEVEKQTGMLNRIIGRLFPNEPID